MKYLLKSIVLLFVITQLLFAQLPEFDDKYSSIEDGKYMPIDWYKSNCINCLGTDANIKCSVNHFDQFYEIGDTVYYYALYHIIDNDYPYYSGDDGLSNGVAIFIGGKNSNLITPVWKHCNYDFMEMHNSPYTFNTKYGMILCIPSLVDGSGFMYSDSYYLRNENQWKRISGYNNWYDSLRKYLPKGHGIAKGLTNLLDEDMIMVTAVWEKGNDSRWPHGGSALIEFEIEDLKIVVKDALYIPPKFDNALKKHKHGDNSHWR